MEYGKQYLTYEDYKALGGELDLTPFNNLEFEARRKVDVRTFNRLQNVDTIPSEVKICIFKMINNLGKYDKVYSFTLENGNIASENTDGYSVSYASASDTKDIVVSENELMDHIIKTYLTGVIVNGEHLLYVGVDNAL